MECQKPVRASNARKKQARRLRHGELGQGIDGHLLSEKPGHFLPTLPLTNQNWLGRARDDFSSPSLTSCDLFFLSESDGYPSLTTATLHPRQNVSINEPPSGEPVDIPILKKPRRPAPSTYAPFAPPDQRSSGRQNQPHTMIQHNRH
jgi:hypothetical protein